MICNAGVSTLLAGLYILDHGCGEAVIDFNNDYRGSWLCLAVLGSLAASCGDTWSSEFGTVIGNSKPRLITTFREVPTGKIIDGILLVIFSFILNQFNSSSSYYYYRFIVRFPIGLDFHFLTFFFHFFLSWISSLSISSSAISASTLHSLTMSLLLSTHSHDLC